MHIAAFRLILPENNQMSRVAPIISVSSFDKIAENAVQTNSKEQDGAIAAILAAEPKTQSMQKALAALKAKKSTSALSELATAISDMEEFIQTAKNALATANIKTKGEIDRSFE